MATTAARTKAAATVASRPLLDCSDWTLISQHGVRTRAAEALRGRRYVLVYLSAHWCPPCRGFTPALRRFYDAHHDTHNFDVVFVSCDRSSDAATTYFRSAHGGWWCLAYDEATWRSSTLMRAYGCSTIPTLLVFEATADNNSNDNNNSNDSKHSSTTAAATADEQGGNGNEQATRLTYTLCTTSGRDMVGRDMAAQQFPWHHAEAQLQHERARMLRTVVAVVCLLYVLWWWWVR